MRNEKTILIVDDIDTNINILIELLEDKYDILASLDGKEALEIVEEEKVDLILLDIMMPNLDGYETCKLLKSKKKTKDIPIIFITSRDDESSIEKAYKVGGVDYITKPFKSREVLSRIENHLSLAEQRLNLQKNLEENITLLNQYKQVVDESALVAKFNKDGYITYVNSAFINTSGFLEEELLGSLHSISMHKGMSEYISMQIFELIQNKKIWHGKVENLKKDGTFYITQDTIMPILDAQGEIKEFISVKHDITEISSLKKEIKETQKEVVFTMGSIGERRSKETGNHVKRVAEYSKIFAKYLGFSEERMDLLVNASPMHDIGKVAIPDEILNKPAKLTVEEFNHMKTHTNIGFSMLNHSSRPLLKTAALIALEHHERWDGKGYPQNLKEEEISLEARITTISDVFDALGSHRCYKKAWEDEDIFKYFQEEKAKQFDPKLVEIFFEHIDEFLEVRNKFRDIY